MWADILAKPLQGAKFHQVCAVLMNCPVDYSEEHPMVNPTILNSPPQFLMKPQIHKFTASPQECIEVSSS